MKRIPSLPKRAAEAWRGCLVFDAPVYTTSIAASSGTVLAATERIYRFARGDTRWQWGAVPEGHGDVTAVAVEPRRAGKQGCMVVATLGALHFFDGEGVITQPLPEGLTEVHHMMWAPRAGALDPTMCLYLDFGGEVLRLLPDEGKGARAFEGRFWQSDRTDDEIHGMASDGDRGVAYGALDEEHGVLDVWALIDFDENLWARRSIPAPGSFFGARLAVAGRAVAVAFDHVGGVWLTRDIKEQELVELEPFHADEDDPADHDRGAALAFEGSSPDAALFIAANEMAQRAAIARVDATGRVERIGELETNDESGVRLIHQMVWDDTRRTLWSAAGRAGVLGSTAPGAPVPIGKGAGAGASS